MAGHDPQRELLASAADEDRRVRLLDRLRVALGAVQLVVRAAIGASGSDHIALMISTASRSMPMRTLASGNS